MARSTVKGTTRLEERRAQFDGLRSEERQGRKRPGSTNAHKGQNAKRSRR